jgi:8-oxo-dGTP diphosphatase
MRYIDKVAWVHIQDRKVLSALSFGKTKYYIPGGKRENGESDVDCLVREIKEELNVDLIGETIIYLDTFQAQADGFGEDVIVKMTCYFGDYSGDILACNEIESIRWVSYHERSLNAKVDQQVFEALRVRGLIE